MLHPIKAQTQRMFMQYYSYFMHNIRDFCNKTKERINDAPFKNSIIYLKFCYNPCYEKLNLCRIHNRNLIVLVGISVVKPAVINNIHACNV